MKTLMASVSPDLTQLRCIDTCGCNVGHQPSSRAAANRSRATVQAAAREEWRQEQYGSGGQDYEDAEGEEGEQDEDQYTAEAMDPDEKTYCYCEQVSFGQMVGCDGDTCEREWVRPFLSRLLEGN
jgi:hypothetical protein